MWGGKEREREVKGWKGKGNGGLTYEGTEVKGGEGRGKEREGPPGYYGFPRI